VATRAKPAQAGKAPKRLYFTDDDEACALIAQDPFALLVGFALDQQITVQQAFAGPLRIKQRVGTLEPKTIAATDLEPVFKEKPAVHRFPGSMAKRVQDLAAVVVEDYGGKAARIWTEAKDADDLKRRLAALPGFGEMKVRTVADVLANQFGIELARPLVAYKGLGGVDSPQALLDYQARKRAHKAELRAAKAKA
jgi:uncharacterized HhH-GPD family protein